MSISLIETGKVVNTHGIYGDVKIQPWADSPDALTEYEYFYIDGKPIKVLSVKVHKTLVIATLEGINSIDAAIKLKNKIISVNRDDIKLEEGSYLICDLIGLKALDAKTNKELGFISEVLTLPAHNVYVIKGKKERLIPAVSEFIIETNISDGYIKFNLIEGL